MSVMEVARITCQKGRGDEFAERLKVGLTVQAEDPECLEAFFQRRVEDPDEFLLQVTWTSVAAHDAWRTANRDRWRAHITDLLEGSPQLLGHYEFVAFVKKAGA